MSVPEKLKNKYSLAGDTYSAKDADRAISDLYACVNRLYTDIGAMRERATKAEEQASLLALEKQALTAENEKLNAEVINLTDANRRITNEAQELDRKFANVSVNASVNDRKLTENTEKLASLLERTEALCSLLDGRTSMLCTGLENSSARFEEAIKELQKIVEANTKNTPNAYTASDKTFEDTVFAFKIDEPISADEASKADAGIEFFITDTPEAQPKADYETPVEDKTEKDTEENNKNIENTENDKTDESRADNDAVNTNELSDDDIKNMLSAMYSTDEVADSAEEIAPTPEEEAATSSENNEKFGSMKTSLDAIRRRLGK